MKCVFFIFKISSVNPFRLCVYCRMQQETLMAVNIVHGVCFTKYIHVDVERISAKEYLSNIKDFNEICIL